MKFAFAALMGMATAIKLQQEIDLSGVSGEDILDALWNEVAGEDTVITEDEYQLIKDDVATFFGLTEEQKLLAEDIALGMIAEDGSISSEDALLLAGKLAGQDEPLDLIEVGELIFQGVDLNEDGVLVKEEILGACEAYGIDVDEELIDAGLEQFDKDGEEGLTFGELAAAGSDTDSFYIDSDGSLTSDAPSDDELVLAQESDSSVDSVSSLSEDSSEDSLDSDDEVLAQQDDSSEDSVSSADSVSSLDSDDEVFAQQDDSSEDSVSSVSSLSSLDSALEDVLEAIGEDIMGSDFEIDAEEAEKAGDQIVKILGLDEAGKAKGIELGLLAMEDDGVIDVEELAFIAGEVTGIEDFGLHDLADSLFKFGDANGDGDLTLEETLAASADLGLSFSAEEIEAAYNSVF